MPFPDHAGFAELVAAGNTYIPVWKRWPADLETPLTTWLKVGASSRHGVLLESVEGGERLGRWSLVVAEPLWTLTVRGERALQCWRDGRETEHRGNPFELLPRCLEGLRSARVPGLPPLGQLFGFWGYELIRWIEPTVPVHPNDPEGPPEGCWMLADSLLVFDQVKRQLTALAYADLSNGASPEEAYAVAETRIAALEQRMRGPLPSGVAPLEWTSEPSRDLITTGNRTQADYETAVVAAREHIAAGDVFQLVISQRLETRMRRDPFEIYRSLRMVNPSPYMAFFNFGGWSLIGSSPEVMVKAEPADQGIRASLRPIAGTRHRGGTDAEDQRLEEELLADPKERAEHVMLVDLGRNDLGRVCRPGSVAVTELMVIERYSHVMHIVSQVEGLLAPGQDIWALLKASFPAGTVSGAPKIRAMQLIHALEPDARGPYSGVYGAVDLCGALNTAITIRTMVVLPHPEGGWRVQVQAGAGLVADSIPATEYQETLNKAQGLLKALACLEDETP
ncbi:anthranilate synthase component I family protein [Synechococcus sp. CS-1325]|uniref:anthranilate synthase component I family protein n=1 Tax=unclassified Synechococcus TaxID=2626047 RepID=UPI000DB1839A|nr:MULTISPECIES: anthranilate synthase component I family protein [unclassified Synechococcus]PZU97494.1 MAG: anthranilate synthase component I [Cyanobium sp.]MCT0198520.1 anthranilate synthase component I family protein [Synechococcus sp. CS-1325]MCT0213804.1 anthranilate synthase component I family protein [Synechococcus sp. CS-1326]MCT0229330.1 anthranilate synthase component I family protein [Synechococcus sp. CS-1324]MCT0233834.1 anthranilate synthase component I family protein [Synechoco